MYSMYISSSENWFKNKAGVPPHRTSVSPLQSHNKSSTVNQYSSSPSCCLENDALTCIFREWKWQQDQSFSCRDTTWRDFCKKLRQTAMSDVDVWNVPPRVTTSLIHTDEHCGRLLKDHLSFSNPGISISGTNYIKIRGHRTWIKVWKESVGLLQRDRDRHTHARAHAHTHTHTHTHTVEHG